MRDALPHLFEHSPDLLYQLVTLVSPAQLKVAALPASSSRPILLSMRGRGLPENASLWHYGGCLCLMRALPGWRVKGLV